MEMKETRSGAHLNFCAVAWLLNPNGIVSFSPRLPRQVGLPWVHSDGETTPTALWPRSWVRERKRPQPRCGWRCLGTVTQGSSFLATLGFLTESRWDSWAFGPAQKMRCAHVPIQRSFVIDETRSCDKLSLCNNLIR